MSETVDRRWTDTDRDVVASNISDRAPSDAAADILDALAAAGRIADPQEATSVDCTVTREDVLHDGRCHSCDEPADRHAPARVVARQQELDRLRKAERERDSLARRCALRYEETERLRGQVSYWSAMAGDRAQERDRLAATIRAMPDAIANSAANLAHARQERDDLRARVAKLEQALHETANLAATTPVDEPTTAVDRLGDIVRRAQQAIRDRWRVSATQMAAGYQPPSMSLERPGRWELPAPPGPEVTEVWDVEGVQWTRQHPSVDRWVCDEHAVWESVRTWGDLLPRGPLSATPPETAGGGQ